LPLRASGWVRSGLSVPHPVEAVVGQSLKQAALDHLVPGIIGDCGGCASCGTCHAYIDEKYLPFLPPADENEELILEGYRRHAPAAAASPVKSL
jgi:ferredoxin